MLNRTDRSNLRQSAQQPTQLAAERYARVTSESVPFVVAKITGSTAITGTTNRWEYEWVMAEILNNATFTHQAVSGEAWYLGTALNVMEGINDATVVGPGVLVANIPSGFSVKPVTGYVTLFPYRLADGTERWVFCVPNAIDGTC